MHMGVIPVYVNRREARAIVRKDIRHHLVNNSRSLFGRHRIVRVETESHMPVFLLGAHLVGAPLAIPSMEKQRDLVGKATALRDLMLARRKTNRK